MGFNSPPPMPQESADQRLLRALEIVPGTRVRLTKESASASSSVAQGTVLEGTVDQVLKIGQPISLDGGVSSTTPITGVSREGGKILIRTQTSVYHLSTAGIEKGSMPATIRSADLERVQDDFSKKGYGEFDMLNGRVPLSDNPYQILLKSFGLKEGTRIRFFTEREREGVITLASSGNLELRDDKGQSWGLQGILGVPEGYITRVDE